MTNNITCLELASDADWQGLNKKIDPENRSECVKAVLRHLRENGGRSVIIEEEYLDRDFTDSYANFYSKVFKRHTKICKRLHFFNTNTKPIFDIDISSEISRALQRAGGEGHYLGFVVLRPVSHAPLSRAVIAPPIGPPQTKSHLLVKADYEAHLLGAMLKVQGLPLTQQDSRIGSCAQACIWMAGRHFHTRHKGPWISTAGITNAAITLPDAQIAGSLPAGSEFLHPNNMVQALRTMDRHPLVYAAQMTRTPQGRLSFSWGNLRPYDIINRYVDSGIPVILGLTTLVDNIGHAVLALGHTMRQIPANTNLPTEATRAEFCECFLVNDDQRGANLRLPIRSKCEIAESPYNIEEHLVYLIVPLPDKVFISGENAEKMAWELLKKYAHDWPAHKRMHSGKIGTSASAGDNFVQLINENKVISRTYLTYGWKYKTRMTQNEISEDFKAVLLYHDLSRYVWVTEFGTLDSLNHLNFKNRRIFAHAVIDATSSIYWEGRSIFHAPGFGLRWFHDPDDPFGGYKDAVTPIIDDAPYFPKLRSDDSFGAYRS